MRVYFYPSYTSPKCVLVFECVNYTPSGFAMRGHITLNLALSMHDDWEWMTHENYGFYQAEFNPLLFHVYGADPLLPEKLRHYSTVATLAEVNDVVAGMHESGEWETIAVQNPGQVGPVVIDTSIPNWLSKSEPKACVCGKTGEHSYTHDCCPF